MAITKSWTDQQDTELVALHGQGLTQAACARRLGISNRRVSEHSKVIGLSWDRSKTKAATEARVADNRSRRAALETRFLVKADDLLEQIDQPHIVFNIGGKDNIYTEHLLLKPPTIDIKNLMSSAGIAIDRSLKIAVHDADTGAGPAKSLLSDLMRGLRIAYEEPKSEDVP